MKDLKWNKSESVCVKKGKRVVCNAQGSNWLLDKWCVSHFLSFCVYGLKVFVHSGS